MCGSSDFRVTSRAMIRLGMAAMALALLLAPAARADIVFHNGTVASGGSGDVNVDLFYVNSPGALLVGKAFHENATHLMAYAYEPRVEPPLLFVEFAVNNETSTPWAGYVMYLAGADFFGANGGNPGGDPARAVNPVTLGGLGVDDILYDVPVGSVSVSSSAITRGAEDSILTISFGDLVDPGESFSLLFFIDDIGQIDEGVVIGQAPVPIPSPTSTTLALLGLGALVGRRR